MLRPAPKRVNAVLPRLRHDGTFEFMTALLEMPEIRRQAFPISVEAYHLLTEGQRTELLRGTIITKMSKSPLHRFISHRLLKILAAQIEPELIAFQEGPISTADSEPEPDLAIVRGVETQFRTAHPTSAELVVEVAVTSLEIDRVKALIYAEAGVKEYWIVCPAEKSVEVYRQPTPQGYAERAVVTAPAVLESSALPGVTVNLAPLFE